MKELMNKERLIAIIKEIGKAPWGSGDKEGGALNSLIPYDAVMLAIESPAQGVSPAEFAGILKGKAWVLEKLRTLLMETNLHPTELHGHQIVLRELDLIERRAPISKLAKQAVEDKRKAEALDKLVKNYSDLKRTKREINEFMDRKVDEFLTQSKIPPKAEEKKP